MKDDEDLREARGAKHALTDGQVDKDSCRGRFVPKKCWLLSSTGQLNKSSKIVVKDKIFVCILYTFLIVNCCLLLLCESRSLGGLGEPKPIHTIFMAN